MFHDPDIPIAHGVPVVLEKDRTGEAFDLCYFDQMAERDDAVTLTLRSLTRPLLLLLRRRAPPTASTIRYRRPAAPSRRTTVKPQRSTRGRSSKWPT